MSSAGLLLAVAAPSPVKAALVTAVSAAAHGSVGLSIAGLATVASIGSASIGALVLLGMFGLPDQIMPIETSEAEVLLAMDHNETCFTPHRNVSGVCHAHQRVSPLPGNEMHCPDLTEQHVDPSGLGRACRVSVSAGGRARKTSVNVGERARRSFVDDILATLPLHGDGVFIFPCMVACIYAIGVFFLGVVRILKFALGLFCVYVCTLLCQVTCLMLSEAGMQRLEARAIGAGRAAAGVYVGYNMIIRENMTWAESVVAGLANVINVIGPLVASVLTALCTIVAILAAVVIACFWLRSRHTVPVAAPRMTHPAELDDIKATVSHAKAELAARGEEVAALRVALSEMVESLRTGRTVASKSTIAAESQATAEASPAAAVPALTGAAAAFPVAPALLTTMMAAPAAVVAAPSPTPSAAADTPSAVPSPQMATLAAPVAEPHPAVAILPMKASSAMAGEAEAAAPPTAASPAKTVPPVSPSPAPATPGASPVAAVDAVSPSAAPPALAAAAATP